MICIVWITGPHLPLCCHLQLYHALRSLPPSRLRCRLTHHDCLFTVQYIGLTGEEDLGLDWGGLYRYELPRVRTQFESAPFPTCPVAPPLTSCGYLESGVCASPAHVRCIVGESAPTQLPLPPPAVFACVAPMLSSDAMQRVVDDLFNRPIAIALFRPSPNAVDGGDDDHGDGLLPDTTRSSTLALDMMKFVGHLMGISFRTKVGGTAAPPPVGPVLL
jgi:hypothetical protein